MVQNRYMNKTFGVCFFFFFPAEENWCFVVFLDIVSSLFSQLHPESFPLLLWFHIHAHGRSTQQAAEHSEDVSRLDAFLAQRDVFTLD